MEAAIAEREQQLRHYAQNTEYEFNRKCHEERLAAFVAGVTTIAVGGATETEQWEREMRAEDAVAATRRGTRTLIANIYVCEKATVPICRYLRL